MLTRILADNFRSLVNFEFRPEKLCLLLGDNGSGKSTVFEVLALASDLVGLGRPAADLFRGTQTRWDSREIQRFELDVTGNGGTYRYALEIKHQLDGTRPPAIRSEEVTFEGERLFRFADGEVHLARDSGKAGADFPFQPNQSFLANLDPRGSRLGWFKGFMEKVRIIQPNPFSMNPTSKGDLRFMGRYCQYLAAFFDYLNSERPDVRAELESRLQEVLPGFQHIRLPRTGDEKVLQAVFADRTGKQHVLGLLELSEGQRVLIALYAALYGLLDETALLCFDEPDNFVSLPETQPWLQTLRDTLDQRGGQAMVVSHHPEVIDYLALDSAWRFERPAGPVVARPLDMGASPGLKPSEIIVRGG
jgi:hypothetical protein